MGDRHPKKNTIDYSSNMMIRFVSIIFIHFWIPFLKQKSANSLVKHGILVDFRHILEHKDVEVEVVLPGCFILSSTDVPLRQRPQRCDRSSHWKPTPKLHRIHGMMVYVYLVIYRTNAPFMEVNIQSSHGSVMGTIVLRLTDGSPGRFVA